MSPPEATGLHALHDQATAWRVVHELPGRLRFLSPVLQGSPDACARLRASLLARPGVHRVEATPRLGSAVIRYAIHRLDRRRLDQLLRDALLDAGLATGDAKPPIAGVPAPASDAQLAALAAGLALTPFLPLPARYGVTALAITPSLWRAWDDWRHRRVSPRMQGALSLLVATLAGRYGAAQIGNAMRLLAERLEARAVDSTESELRQLAAPDPMLYRIEREGREVSVALQDLRAGDRLRLGPDDVAPLDAMVLAGEADVVFSGSGEREPLGPGDWVSAGATPTDGFLHAVLLQDWTEGSAARMAEFIDMAIEQREQAVRYASKLASRLVPYSMVVSGAVYGFTRDLARTASALQADFGASLALVTPVTVESSVACGASGGILFRGGESLERLAAVDTVVFDRYGTLTENQWRLRSVEVLDEGLTERQLERWVSRVLLQSCRPAVEPAGSRDTGSAVDVPVRALTHAERVRLDGQGLHARVEDRSLALVSLELAVKGFGIEAPVDPTADSERGVVHACLVHESRCLGVVRFVNRPVPHAEAAIEALRADGIAELHMISHESANDIHPRLWELALDGFHVDLDEFGKLAFLRGLAQRGRRVALVSDGLFQGRGECLNICLGANLAPRQLDADLWLLRPRLEDLLSARRLARRTLAAVARHRRINLWSNGAVLLAASFDLLPPSLASFLGNSVTLGLLRDAARVKEESL